MFYIGRRVLYFEVQCEDQVLHALSYLHQGTVKVLCIEPVAHRELFEWLFAKEANEETLVNVCGGIREALKVQ